MIKLQKSVEFDQNKFYRMKELLAELRYASTLYTCLHAFAQELRLLFLRFGCCMTKNSVTISQT